MLRPFLPVFHRFTSLRPSTAGQKMTLQQKQPFVCQELRDKLGVMKTLISSSLLSLFVTLGACTLVLPGCRSDAEAVCDYKCECEGCSDAVLNDCYNEQYSKEREADAKGCLNFYDDLKACEYDTWYCKSNNEFETACKVEKENYDACRK